MKKLKAIGQTGKSARTLKGTTKNPLAIETLAGRCAFFGDMLAFSLERIYLNRILAVTKCYLSIFRFFFFLIRY